MCVCLSSSDFFLLWNSCGQTSTQSQRRSWLLQTECHLSESIGHVAKVAYDWWRVRMCALSILALCALNYERRTQKTHTDSTVYIHAYHILTFSLLWWTWFVTLTLTVDIFLYTYSIKCLTCIVPRSLCVHEQKSCLCVSLSHSMSITSICLYICTNSCVCACDL